MNKKAVLLWLVALLLMVACGGGGGAEPDASTTDNDTSSSTTTETSTEPEPTEAEPEETQPVEEESVEEESTEETAGTEEVEESEEVSEEAPAEEAASSPFGDRPMSGIDPETNLAVNPDTVRPGDTFIVRGEIISMNLTPTTSPEFLIQSPDGLKFRLRSQDLAETYFEDGDQLEPYQYQLGLLAEATATLAADASPSDIPTSTDLVLVKNE